MAVILLVRAFLALSVLVGTAWMFGVIWFDAPFGRANPWLAALFVAALGIGLRHLSPWRKRLATWFAVWLIMIGCWLLQQPRHDRLWQADVALTAWAERQGDEVTLHNVRNFTYHGNEQGFTALWQTRKLRLSSVEGLDVAFCYWGSPWMCHPILGFRFRDTPPLCFSIEARKEQGEGYS